MLNLRMGEICFFSQNVVREVGRGVVNLQRLVRDIGRGFVNLQRLVRDVGRGFANLQRLVRDVGRGFVNLQKLVREVGRGFVNLQKLVRDVGRGFVNFQRLVRDIGQGFAYLVCSLEVNLAEITGDGLPINELGGDVHDDSLLEGDGVGVLITWVPAVNSKFIMAI